MEILRGIVIIAHFVGFALLFGAWAVEAFNRRLRISTVMQWGMALALLTGLILAAPWALSGPLNYTKIGIKLVVLITIGAALGIAAAKQKRNQDVPAALFWAIGGLTLVNAAIAVLV